MTDVYRDEWSCDGSDGSDIKLREPAPKRCTKGDIHVGDENQMLEIVWCGCRECGLLIPVSSSTMQHYRAKEFYGIPGGQDQPEKRSTREALIRTARSHFESNS